MLNGESNGNGLIHPDTLLYSTTGLWIRINNEQTKTATIGITDYTQDQMGDITYITMQNTTKNSLLKEGEIFGYIESVKAITELYIPMSANVCSINESVLRHPELLNTDPYSEGWLLQVAYADEQAIKCLFTAQKYRENIREERKRAIRKMSKSIT